MSIAENISRFRAELPENVHLVAVSKTKSNEEIMEAYQAGQRVFGENKIQDMVAKQEALPKDIQWHMIGHVQTNKVKYMAPFVNLIHGIDSLKLLKEVNKQALKNERRIDSLLQLHIAEEESKFGLSESEAEEALAMAAEWEHVKVIGLMGMATFTEDKAQISAEFRGLKNFFDRQQAQYPDLKILSMGMSGDYLLAIAQGSNMIRVGSKIFGPRNY
ncbi:MAG: YggS family pyridoxal phosphate-dependent enzyme [Bacteroidetes bacterium]|nr:YggS family pyridoxal phosphate-dependent enzyme [Bacteroidota bacterium]MDA0936045.1 YggS family pyridoxal phosphate-dependent enzyme [Bacteroidota bacterium]